MSEGLDLLPCVLSNPVLRDQNELRADPAASGDDCAVFSEEGCMSKDAYTNSRSPPVLVGSVNVGRGKRELAVGGEVLSYRLCGTCSVPTVRNKIMQSAVTSWQQQPRLEFSITK